MVTAVTLGKCVKAVRLQSAQRLCLEGTPAKEAKHLYQYQLGLGRDVM